MAIEMIENHPYEEIRVGQTAELQRTLTRDDIVLFGKVSGDLNPTHVDADYASKSAIGTITGHSLWSSGLISSLLGNLLPGPGTVYRKQDVQFHRPIALDDRVTARIRVREKGDDNRVVFDCDVVNLGALREPVPDLGPMLFGIMLLSAGMAGAIFYVSYRFSNRVAGPAWRVIQSLKRIREGDAAFRVKLRHGDLLLQLVDELNVTLEQLEQQRLRQPDTGLVGVELARLGYVDIDIVRSIDPEFWPQTLVGDVYVAAGPDNTVSPDDSAESVLQRLLQDGRRKFLVASGTHLQGVITLADLVSYLNLVQSVGTGSVKAA